jgi:hypothetical protein
MDISTNTLTLAMHALAVEIETLKAAVAGPDDDQADEKSQRVLDMQAALSELGAVYEERRALDPDLTPAVDWLPAER